MTSFRTHARPPEGPASLAPRSGFDLVTIHGGRADAERAMVSPLRGVPGQRAFTALGVSFTVGQGRSVRRLSVTFPRVRTE